MRYTSHISLTKYTGTEIKLKQGRGLWGWKYNYIETQNIKPESGTITRIRTIANTNNSRKTKPQMKIETAMKIGVPESL